MDKRCDKTKQIGINKFKPKFKIGWNTGLFLHEMVEYEGRLKRKDKCKNASILKSSKGDQCKNMVLK